MPSKEKTDFGMRVYLINIGFASNIIGSSIVHTL